MLIRAGNVEHHIRRLAHPAMRGRTGRHAELAANYIRQHFLQFGLHPLFDDDKAGSASGYYQLIPGRKRDDGSHDIAGRNVGAWLPGSDPELRHEFIVVSAHFDHLGVAGGRVYPGADDNASGVSMLIEVARTLATSRQRPKRSIAFVGFDLEEHLLWGSRWFAAHPPWPLEQLKLFMTADMIGRSLGGLDLPMVFVLGAESAPQLGEYLDSVEVPEGLEISRFGTDLIGTRSDYGPFRDRGIPFLFFSTGEHPDYHTPGDVVDRIRFDQATRITELILRLTRRAGDSDTPPVWTDERAPDLEEAKSLSRITTILLEQHEQNVQFNDVQIMLINHIHSRTKLLLDRDQMTKGEREWLTRSAKLLLLSVF